MPNRFYVTTPIYYVNDRPHIGHVYTTTIADVLARYHRLAGDDVFFLTGVDEHAAKVVDAAKERGLTPQQWADQNAASFRDTFAKLAITNDDFVRTSEDRHKKKVQEYVAALMKSGDIYAGQYEGWYDAGQEEYVTDSKAQESGFKSPINGKPLVRKTEKNYFFKLSAYREQLLTLLEKGEKINDQGFDVQPEARKNEIISRIREMNDVPISRTGSGGWGIPVPGDAEQTIYVWIDALFNYLTYVDTPERRPYWQSGAVHLIAKDILWFHAAIWPAMLLALAKCEGYDWVNLPKLVYAHSFWISEGQKMSKSLGNFIDLEKIDQYVATFGLDALRYFLATQGPLGTTDSDFAEAKFIETYNTDLANVVGNCASRIINMTSRYWGGKVPSSANASTDFNLEDFETFVDVALYAIFGSRTGWEPKGNVHKMVGLLAVSSLSDSKTPNLNCALHYAITLVSMIDEYIEITAPFKLAKDPAKLPEVGTILYNCAEAIRVASALLWPVMPGKMEELWRRLGCDYAQQMQSNGGRGNLDEWTKWGLLQPGTPIPAGDALFPRYQPPK
ncbi:MAG: methionine--tRNA ligase [Planctomycetes bacterium]|nr:methionine--tRNA ligase [Planctomycetota bacterium]